MLTVVLFVSESVENPLKSKRFYCKTFLNKKKFCLQEEISEPVMPLFEPPPQYQNPDDDDSDDDSKDPDYKDTGTFVRTYSKYDWQSSVSLNYPNW
jgi:hypothetical protein